MLLLDAAMLVDAARKGFAAAGGIDLARQRESSWATIRDRLAVGQMEASHMLGSMPTAPSLGLAPLHARTAVPMALGLGGNAVTVSNAPWAAMEGEGARPNLDPAGTGAALRRVIAGRSAQGSVRGLRPRFAAVHPTPGTATSCATGSRPPALTWAASSSWSCCPSSCPTPCSRGRSTASARESPGTRRPSRRARAASPPSRR